MTMKQWKWLLPWLSNQVVDFCEDGIQKLIVWYKCLFVFVLMEWSLLPNALWPFKIYCAPPNLGITRTWIYRLNFAQRSIFSDLWFFNEPEISDSDSPLKVPPGGLVFRIFTSWKIHRPQPDLNPRTFDVEASMLHRDHRGRHRILDCQNCVFKLLIWMEKFRMGVS